MNFLIILVLILTFGLKLNFTEAKSSKFSDFCKSSNLVLTKGKQIENGSCSFTQQGEIPSINKMVSSFIISPKNGAILKASEPFKITVITKNLETGHFSDPNNQYYAFPQQLNSKGQIKGHQHITIQKISEKLPPDASATVFFKGLDQKAQGDFLSVTIDKKLEKGLYRICTMSGSFSHQPLIMPVARRGAQDDCIRFETK